MVSSVNWLLSINPPVQVMATALGMLLVILIALEVMQILTEYPRDHVIQMELALVSARPSSDKLMRHVAG